MTSFTLTSHAPTRITFILHQLGRGGVERVAAILANGFSKQGIETELLVCASGGPGEHELKSLVGGKVKLRFFLQTSGSRATDLFIGFFRIGHYLIKSKPDIVVSAGNNVSLFSMLLTRIYCPWKTRLVIKTTNPVQRPYDKKSKRMFRHLCYAFIFRLSDGVLTLTEAESARLEKIYPWLADKLLTVSNPYIYDNRGPIFELKNDECAGRQRLILAAGRLHRQKRFDILLHAFARVREMTDCRLVILGEGEDRVALNRLSNSLGIAQFVAMPGFVPDVSYWFRKADLFVLSSDYEGLPAVVLEALSCNCPVVSTDCFHGVKDLLEGAAKCAVIPARDPQLLAEAIVDSIAKTCSTVELHLVAEKYRIEPAIDSHLSAINQLVLRERAVAA